MGLEMIWISNNSEWEVGGGDRQNVDVYNGAGGDGVGGAHYATGGDDREVSLVNTSNDKVRVGGAYQVCGTIKVTTTSTIKYAVSHLFNVNKFTN